jgi:hypothetical protein
LPFLKPGKSPRRRTSMVQIKKEGGVKKRKMKLLIKTKSLGFFQVLVIASYKYFITSKASR